VSAIIATPQGATPLDPDELEGLRFKHVTTRDQLNELEQANLDAGLLWLARQKQLELSVDQMCKLHARLFGEVWSWAGTFRRTEKTIGVDPLQIGVQSKMLLDDVAWWVEHRSAAPPAPAGSRAPAAGPHHGRSGCLGGVICSFMDKEHGMCGSGQAMFHKSRTSVLHAPFMVH
jgi:fido (protein-threonine AMPylation protein)